MEKSSHDHNNLLHKAGRAGAGLILSTIAIGGGAMVADGALSITHDVAFTTEHAEPSNLLADGFTALEDVGAALGAAVLLKRGLHNFRVALSPQEAALDEVAHSSTRTKTFANNKLPRALAACSLVTACTGVVAGSFFNIADNVSKAQSNAALFLDKFNEPHKEGYVISNSPVPDILNTSSVSSYQLRRLDSEAKNDKVNLIPIQHELSGGEYLDNKSSNYPTNYNLEFLTLGLPTQYTHLPLADQSCNDIEVNASSALGVKPGDFFELQGLRVKVNDLIKGYAGFNLLPVTLNNSDYNRCLFGDKNSVYSMVLAEGTPSSVRELLRSVSNNNNNLSDRLYAVTLDQFVNNAEETGKNAVNGLVLEAMVIGMALGAIALNYKVSQDLANNRSRNRMLKANGFDDHLIMKIYNQRAEVDAVFSAILAMPGTLLVDTIVNHAQPGGALGINIETYAAVTGFLWAINKISTSRAVRKEAKVMVDERKPK